MVSAEASRAVSDDWPGSDVGGRPRLGIVTIGDPADRRTWSGTPGAMLRALEGAHGPLARIGPLRAPALKPCLAYARVLQGILGRRFSAFHAGPVVASYVADARRKIAKAGVRAVLAPAGSTFAAGVPDDVAFVYTSDATSRLLQDYYPRYERLTPAARRNIERLEAQAIARADLLLYPTAWAAESAIRDYGADPARVRILPWGANMVDPPGPEIARPREPDGVCRLLLVGVDWIRKGADIAVEALAALRGGGLEAELTVVGCTPPRPVEAAGLTVIPFLDKADPAQAAQLRTLFRNADFLLLPTRAECYGVAFCEAAAFGLPAIGTATGGVPGIVREGENGYLLPTEARGTAYAEVIAEILAEPGRLAALRRSSRAAYDSRLDWSVWGRCTAELIAGLIASDRP